MVIILKICLFVYIVLLSLSGHKIYKEYEISKKSEEYDNSNLFGKILISTIFYITISAFCGMVVFLIYMILSKITIEWVF